MSEQIRNSGGSVSATHHDNSKAKVKKDGPGRLYNQGMTKQQKKGELAANQQSIERVFTTENKHWKILKNNISAAVLKIASFGTSEVTDNARNGLLWSFQLTEKLSKTFKELYNNNESATSNLQDAESAGNFKVNTAVFRREPVRVFPFCESYDGYSVRKTKTISESIQAIIAERQEKEENHIRQTVELIATEKLASSNFCQDLIKDDDFASENEQDMRDK